MYEEQCFRSVYKAQTAFTELESIVFSAVGYTWIIDAQCDDSRGHINLMAGLAYTHACLFRGLARLQVYYIHKYSEAF